VPITFVNQLRIERIASRCLTVADADSVSALLLR
jgi:hypothetical protein